MIPARFYQGQPGTGETTLYTVPAGRSVILKHIMVTNTTGSAATFTLSLVPSGGSPAASNRLYVATSVPANGLISLILSQVMNQGDFLSALQPTTNALTMHISGVLI